MSGTRDDQPLLETKGQAPSPYSSFESKIEKTAHYFDLDKTITNIQLQYKPKKPSNKDIIENIKSEFAPTIRHLLMNKSVIAIISRADKERVDDILKLSGLTPFEIARIRVFAEGKDDGSEYDENFKKNAVKQLIEENPGVNKHYFYDDSAQECIRIDELKKTLPTKSIATYKASPYDLKGQHFHFARVISSNPSLEIKIEERIGLNSENDPTKAHPDTVKSISKAEFNKVLDQYQSTSCWAVCFSSHRSKTIRNLHALSQNESVTLDPIINAIGNDSNQRLNLFYYGTVPEKYENSTDEVILDLASRFRTIK